MDTLKVVREAVYGEIVRSGRAPSLAALSESTGIAPGGCRAALAALAEGQVLGLEDDGETIWLAPPFAARETRYRVRSGEQSWFAPCAWDSFGIAAALRRDVEFEVACSYSGVPLGCGVRAGAVYGEAVVHMLVPAARFWDNIGFT